MIDTFLPPLDRGSANQWGETLEGFAYSYLASYGEPSGFGSDLLSFRRAWNPTALAYFVTATTPSIAFRVGYYVSGNSCHVVVGFPGVNDVIALMAAAAGVSGLAVGSYQGLVFSSFQRLGIAAYNQLLNDRDFIGYTHQKAVSINFAGFSQGAAVAEVCWALWQQNNPSLPAKLFKFGSPRVGNYAWVNGRRIDTFRCSIRNDADPITGMPYLCTSLLPYTGAGNGWNNTFYETDPVEEVFNWSTLAQDGSTQGTFGTTLFQNAVYPLANWRYHGQNVYRKLLARLTAGLRGDSLSIYRFLPLEFPFENSFQYDYATDPLSLDVVLSVLGPPPPVVVVPSRVIPRSPTPDTTFGDGGGGGDGDDVSPGSTPNVLTPMPAAPGVPSWSNGTMAIRNRSRGA